MSASFQRGDNAPRPCLSGALGLWALLGVGEDADKKVSLAWFRKPPDESAGDSVVSGRA